jgi:hypothetical protein
MKIISQMQHIKESGMDFDPRLANRFMRCLKEAVLAGVWKGLCPEWFVDDKSRPVQQPSDAVLKEFIPAETNTPFDAMFEMVFSNGKRNKVRLHEQNLYGSFYSNKEIYSIAKPPTCIILDVVLAKGRPESIVESYYSAMRFQQQTGGQSNDILARRTKLSWCLPSLKLCDNIIAESVKLYHKGDDQFKRHRSNIFASDRAQDYDVSKVVDRVDSDMGRCPFLAK